MIAFVTECANVEKTHAHQLAFWDGKGLAGLLEYEVKDTTCERAYQGETYFYPQGLQQLFPVEKAATIVESVQSPCSHRPPPSWPGP